MPDPIKVNLGSGKDYRPGYVNIDHSTLWKPDLVHDLETGLPPEIKPGAVSEFIAMDLLEHIHNLTGLMKACIDALHEGGVLIANVPYDLSYGAWQDPTHVRAFNERSWLYYGEWCWYLGWTESRFVLDKMQFMLSPLGQRLQQEGVSLDGILLQPRAVDSMLVTLRKEKIPVQPNTVRHGS